MGQIQRLSWDSDFFGIEVGSIRIGSSVELAQLIESSKSFDLVYVFSNKPINHERLNLVDEKLTYTQPLKRQTNIEDNENVNISTYENSKVDILALKLLAREAGIFSRFYTDEKIDNKFYISLYDKWLENSVKGEMAIQVYVASVKERLAGLITLQKKDEKTSRIGLIATSKEMRGKKVASSLIDKIISGSLEKGFKNVEVITQKRNLPANKLYESKGFVVKDLQYIYHLWNI